MDPLAEQFPAVSPFAYTLNNPIRLRDVAGLFPEDLLFPDDFQLHRTRVTFLGPPDAREAYERMRAELENSYVLFHRLLVPIGQNKGGENQKSQTVTNAASSTAMASEGVAFFGKTFQTRLVRPGMWYDVLQQKWYSATFWGNQYTTSQKLVTNIAAMSGKVGRFFSGTGAFLSGLYVGLETYQFYQGRITLGRYTYHIGSTGTAAYVAFTVGSGWGLLFGISALAIEKQYDHIRKKINDFNNNVREYGILPAVMGFNHHY